MTARITIGEDPSGAGSTGGSAGGSTTADTFVPVIGDACPSGSKWSDFLQVCMTADGYRSRLLLAKADQNLTLYNQLRADALKLGFAAAVGSDIIAPSGNLIDTIGAVLKALAPIGVGLIGLALVFIAVSSMVNLPALPGPLARLPKMK